jgi:signal transduction histidine kinase
MLFRIIQEAMHNSLKHANAKIMRITIDLNNLIMVTVADDGTGFQPGDMEYQGVGIINMKHRTKLLGGNIEWKAKPEGGTEVRIFLPIQK